MGKNQGHLIFAFENHYTVQVFFSTKFIFVNSVFFSLLTALLYKIETAYGYNQRNNPSYEGY